MSVETQKIAATRSSWWNRVRLQLGGGLLIAVIIPWFLRLQFEEGDLTSLQNSAVGTAVALILGYYGFRRLARYPGVRSSYHILPSFGIAYGLIMAGFFFARLEYSRLHFFLSFVLCCLWFYEVYSQMRRQQSLRIGVLPFGSAPSLFEIEGVEWVRLTEANRSHEPCDAIVADLRAEIPDDWERYLADQAIEGVLVMHVKQMQESLTGRVSIEHLSENNLGSLIPGVVYGKIKRAGDLAATLLALPLLLPFFAFIALVIKLDSKGPVLFRQQRIGGGGRVFTMYKFRTMAHRCAPDGNPRDDAVTRDNDLRVTRPGRFLRRYRLDELPQIVNILRGEMSWIGPRPEAVPLSQWYEAEIPFYRYRHIVRPGITGWAQVNQGHVADVDQVHGKLHYDFYYVKNFSFWLDILIVARTIRTVTSGFGAR